MFYGLEAIRGRPLPDKLQIFFQQVGMALLLLLMVTAMFVDVQRLVG
jgi:regulator of sigma E protease